MPPNALSCLVNDDGKGHPRLSPGRLATLALVFLIAACESPDGLQPGYDARVQLREEYPDVSVRRVGDYSSTVEDYHDVAIIRAFKRIEGTGNPRERILSVVIETPVIGGLSGGMSFPFAGVPSHYDIWITLADCDSPVYFRASGTGFLQTSQDKAGCLTQEQG